MAMLAEVDGAGKFDAAAWIGGAVAAAADAPVASFRLSISPSLEWLLSSPFRWLGFGCRAASSVMAVAASCFVSGPSEKTARGLRTGGPDGAPEEAAEGAELAMALSDQGWGGGGLADRSVASHSGLDTAARHEAGQHRATHRWPRSKSETALALACTHRTAPTAARTEPHQCTDQTWRPERPERTHAGEGRQQRTESSGRHTGST